VARALQLDSSINGKDLEETRLLLTAKEESSIWSKAINVVTFGVFKKQPNLNLNSDVDQKTAKDLKSINLNTNIHTFKKDSRHYSLDKDIDVREQGKVSESISTVNNHSLPPSTPTLQPTDGIDHYDTKSKFSSAYDASPNPSPSPSPFLGNGNRRVVIQPISSPSPNNGNGNGNTIQLIPSTSLASPIEWYDDSQQNNVNNSITTTSASTSHNQQNKGHGLQRFTI
jgi:hypothetical protein